MNIFNQIKGFISKYGDEASLLAGALRTIIMSLPIQRQEKQKLDEVINRFENVKDNLENALTKMKEPPKVVIERKMLEDVVKKLLPAMIEKVVSEKLEEKGMK